MLDKNDVVIINLDRPRTLRFGHSALKKMLSATGKNLEEFDVNNFDLEEVEKIMYFGLLSDAKKNNETLKLEDMEELLDQASTFSEIIEKMQLALNVAFGDFGDFGQIGDDLKNLPGIAENK